jgi:diguanylate cyclase (GGDEF)-like protein
MQGLLLQAIGVLPLAGLTFLLSRSIQRDYLRYFWRAWTALAVGLFALYFAFRVPGARAALEPLYFLGEYVFAGFILAGCRNLATGARLGRRQQWMLVPAAAMAVALSHLHHEFTVRFIPQAAIMSAFFVLALREVRRTPSAGRGRVGGPLLQSSLFALAILFAHYVPVLLWPAWSGRELPGPYAAYTSLFDLLFETLLGFGTIIAVMEREHFDLGEANRALLAARESLEAAAKMDPLTSSLNRHAFYSMVEGRRSALETSGSVVVVDIDRLKSVNDTLGHSAGDTAIRSVARAIRQVVRADDLVFRWGGDEFLVVLFGLAEDEARQRLEGIDQVLRGVTVAASTVPLAVAVSAGVASFTTVAELEKAIESADQRMYARKQAKQAEAARLR